MKNLLKIGVLILFMIGLFTVQLDFKPLLVDNDVGMEYADNLIYFNAGINVELETPCQVAAPLKCPLISSEYILYKHVSGICFEALNDLTFMVNQDNTNLPETMLTTSNRQTKLMTDLVSKRRTRGLCRLEIGESFYINYLS